MSRACWRSKARASLPVLFAMALVVVIVQEHPGTTRSVATAGGPPSSRGYVLGPGDGEALNVPNGRVVIKVDPKTGSSRLAMGTQVLTQGNGIALHLHEREDEILFLHEGARTVVVGDATKMVAKGTTVYIPHGVWHGVMSANDEAQVVWIVSPPGLEEFFREVGTAPGIPPRALTLERLADIRRKHGMKSP